MGEKCSGKLPHPALRGGQGSKGTKVEFSPPWSFARERTRVAGAAGGDPYWRLSRAGVQKVAGLRSAVWCNNVRGWSRGIGLDAKEEEDRRREERRRPEGVSSRPGSTCGLSSKRHQKLESMALLAACARALIAEAAQ